MNDSFIPTAIGWVLALAVFIFVVVVIVRSIRIIPQAAAGVVERLGRYHKTLEPGLNLLVPFIDRVRPLIDMREQVVSFPPQPVITEDNLVVSIDTVVYFQVTDARAATYEIRNYLGAVEQLTTTTLRNVVGGLNLEEALTSRDEINGQLRIVLDEATGKWGIRVGLAELLRRLGYKNVSLKSYNTSDISSWVQYGLDANDDGSEYAPGSLYIEASK